LVSLLDCARRQVLLEHPTVEAGLHTPSVLSSSYPRTPSDPTPARHLFKCAGDSPWPLYQGSGKGGSCLCTGVDTSPMKRPGCNLAEAAGSGGIGYGGWADRLPLWLGTLAWAFRVAGSQPMVDDELCPPPRGGGGKRGKKSRW